MIIKLRFNIMLNPKVVVIIDKLAKQKGVSRSYYINNVLFDHIKEFGELYSEVS